MKILHIDDTQTILDSFSKILTLCEHEVTSCLDGKTGLALLSEQKFDLILLDLAMPDFSGIDFLEVLEKLESSIPDIFIFTAVTLTDKEKAHLIEKGIKKILFKPINTEELILELEKFQPKVMIHE